MVRTAVTDLIQPLCCQVDIDGIIDLTYKQPAST